MAAAAEGRTRARNASLATATTTSARSASADCVVAVAVRVRSDAEVAFDLTGVDASVANALRRAMTADVPTFAIEDVFVEENTCSTATDDELAHRLSLVPIAVPESAYREFEACARDPSTGELELSDTNSISFSLDVSSSNSEPRRRRQKVFSSALQFRAEGAQSRAFRKAPRAAVPDIVLCTLAPGQRVKLTCVAVLGAGHDHAKFSPTAPATYRGVPKISVRAADGSPRATGDAARALKQLCPADVFDIEDLGDGRRAAVVARPRACTMCRECVVRMPTAVELSRAPDAFEVSVESTGARPAPDIVLAGADVLRGKCAGLRAELARLAGLGEDEG
jgi:DNA-directed RNA polymerase I and III subunit RPAC1